MDKQARPGGAGRWLFLAVVPLYVLGFFLPFARITLAGLVPAWGMAGSMAAILGVVDPAQVVLGAESWRLARSIPSFLLFWVAHPLLWVAVAGLARRRWWVAGIAGANATLLGLMPLLPGEGPELMVGYHAWLGSMVAVAAAGFLGLSRLGEETRRWLRIGWAAASLGAAAWLIPVALLPREDQGRPVGAWVADLGSSDRAVAERATEVLARIGPRAIPELIGALKDSRRQVSRAAAGLFDRLGPRAEAAVPALTEAVRRPDAETASLAFRALVHMGPAGRPGLVAALGGSQGIMARESLVAIGPASIPALLGALRDPRKEARREVLDTLDRYPRLPGEAVPPLLALVSDGDESTRRRAWSVLARVDSPGVEVVPALLKSLDLDPHSGNLLASEILAKVGPPAVPALIGAIKVHREDRVPDTAAEALARIGAPAVPALIPLLDDPADQARSLAAFALGRIGPPARPALLAALKDGPSRARVHAAKALGGAGSEAGAVVPALRAALADPDIPVRAAAAEALGRIGPGAKEAVPDLIALLKDRHVWGTAAEALGRIGPGAKEAVPDLIALLEDRRVHVPMVAAVALHRIDPPARDVIPLVAVVARLPYKAGERHAAIQALGRLGPAAVPELVAAIGEEKDLSNRKEIVRQFSGLGPGMEQAIPTLEALQQDPDFEIRNNARLTLDSLREVARRKKGR